MHWKASPTFETLEPPLAQVDALRATLRRKLLGSGGGGGGGKSDFADAAAAAPAPGDRASPLQACAAAAPSPRQRAPPWSREAPSGGLGRRCGRIAACASGPCDRQMMRLLVSARWQQRHLVVPRQASAGGRPGWQPGWPPSTPAPRAAAALVACRLGSLAPFRV